MENFILLEIPLDTLKTTFLFNSVLFYRVNKVFDVKGGHELTPNKG